MAAATATVDAPRRVFSGSIKRNRRWALYWSYFFLILFAIFFLVPPYYQLVTATKTSDQISNQSTNPWLPALSSNAEGLNPGGENANKASLAVKPSDQGSWVPAALRGAWANIKQLMTTTDFPIYFRNTAIVTVLVVIITMVIAVPAAFSLGRMKFWGSGLLATGVFLTYLVPDSLLFIPLFKVVGGFGLLDSYWALVLVYPTLSVPFATWIMIGYFQSIPKELDEAALIDGANYLQMLFKIFIPVALPGVIAATIFAFTVSWAAFVYPMAFIYTSDQLVLTAGTITSLVKADVYQWGMIMTAALLAAAPPLIIYAFLMDYYIAGLTAGATKG